MSHEQLRIARGSRPWTGLASPDNQGRSLRRRAGIAMTIFALGVGVTACSSSPTSAAPSTREARMTTTSGARTAQAAPQSSPVTGVPTPMGSPHVAPPADAKVIVTKGAASSPMPNCQHASCARVAVALEGFVSTATCTFSDNVDGTWWSTTLPAGFTGDTQAYFGFPGRVLTVTCDAVKGSMTWS